MEYLIGIIFALLSMIGRGFDKIFSKKVIERIDSYSSLVYINLTGFVILLIISLFFGLFSFPDKGSLYYILLAGLIGSIAIYSLYSGLKKYKLSVIYPIALTYPLFASIFNFIIFKESISPILYFFGSIIVLGAIILSVELRSYNSESIKGIIYGIITSIGWGVYSIFIKIIAKNYNYTTTSIFLEFSVLIFILLPVLFKFKKIEKIKNVPLKWIGLSSVLFAIGSLFSVAAIKYAPIPVVTSITSASIMVSLIASRFILKEKLTKIQVIGISLISISIVIITIWQ